MQNYQDLVRKSSLLRCDKDAIGDLAPGLQSLLLNKQNITQQYFVNEFFEYFGEEIKYEDIVALFEDIWKSSTARKEREKYLLSHWLYYQTFRFIPNLNQEGLMIQQIQQMIDKKQQCGNTIENIAKKIQLKTDQKDLFCSNIRKSSIYRQCAKFLIPSNELSVQKIHEKHEELIYITRKMRTFGQSIQYQLQKHILASFQKIYKINSNQGTDSLNQLIQINSLFELIRKQDRNNSKIKGKIQDFKVAKDEKSKYNFLEGIKSELTILDVFLLEYLIFLSKKNSQNNNNEPKNIVLLVGPSGSGKTTIILRLLGYKLIQTEIRQLPTLQPLELRPQHNALRSSPESTSTTRYMFSTKIPKTSFQPGSYQELQICDTPGFEDSAGCEVDISNSISIQTFLKSCMSVKLAVVISQRKVGDRMEGIRQIAKIVSNLVVKYSEIENDVAIILNKFDSQAEYDRIKPGLDSVLDNLTPAEQSIEEYVAFLKSLAKRFKNKKRVNVIRFHPQETDIKEVIQQMKQGKIMNPRSVFKYSLSTKSTQCIANRKTVLVRLIRQYIGQNNNLALYYLNELILLNSCLDQNDIEQEINKLKQFIRKQVDEKFITFEDKIKDQILQNDANSNTFKELNKIKEQVKTFEIFTKFIDKLTTVQKIQFKITEVKAKMLENLNTLLFQEGDIQQSKRKVINTIKFFSKFQPQKQKSVLDKIFEIFSLKKNELKQIFDKKIYEKLRSKTSQLKNIYQVMQKGRQSINIDSYNPQKIIISIDKQQLEAIKEFTILHFEQIVQQSTNFIDFFKENSSNLDIKKETIEKIQQNITIFEKLEDEGAILQQIYAKDYKNKIINAISCFGKELIQQCNKILDPHASKRVEPTKMEYIRRIKMNTLKLKQIKGVYATIGEQIDKLWSNFQKFISMQTQRLNTFLSQLKCQKMINKNTLKNFKSMIDKIIKFSQGDDNLVESISQLKIEIKKSLLEHIMYVKSKIDTVKITLKFKKTLEIGQLKKTFEFFKEIEAFYKIKSFNRQNYLQVSKQSAKKLKKGEQQKNDNNDNDDNDNDDDEEDYDDINISTQIRQTYEKVINKMFNPFKEITQSQKINNGVLKRFTSSDLQMLNNFIQYKSKLVEYQITQNKDFNTLVRGIISQPGNYLQNIRQKLKDLKSSIDNCSIEEKVYFKNQIENYSIEEKAASKPLYRFQIQEIKQFKKISNIVLGIKKYQSLQEFFVQENFDCNQYIAKIVNMLKQSEQLLKEQLANRNRSSLDFINMLQPLQKITQQMKYFDNMEFQDDNTNQFEFGKIHQKISQQILEIQGKQSNSINNLFNNQALIIISDVKSMYLHLSKDKLRNQDKLFLLSNQLKTYGDKLNKNFLYAKGQYKNEESMVLQNSQNALLYIISLEKLIIFYYDLKQFAEQKVLQVLTINEAYFATQIAEFAIEERLKQTYETAKRKISSYEYRKKPKQFQKIISIIKKTEYILEQVTNNKSQLSQIKPEDELEKDFKINKFSQQLKNLMKESGDQVKDILANQNNKQFLNLQNFAQMYNNSPENERLEFDAKIQTIMRQKFQDLDLTYQKTEEQKKIVEEDINKTLDKLPNNNAKNLFTQKIQNRKDRLKERQNAQVSLFKNQLNSKQPVKNFFELLTQFQQCKNPRVQKECKSIIEKQLKALVRDMLVFNNKKMQIFQSFKKYLKFFGSQNAIMIEKIKNNQKIKGIFSAQQRYFLNSLISEQKQLIREIDEQLKRCSIEAYQRINQRCRQMNQLYVSTLEDEYQGMCITERNQIIHHWEQYIRIKFQKIQQLLSASEINIINSAPHKIQKLIIETKLTKIFIDNFTEQSGKLMKGKTFQFIQSAHTKFAKYNIDRIITNFSRQVNEVITAIQSITFYDDQIKILNYASLQVQFQNKLIKPLKIVKEYQQIYNKYLCQREQDKYENKKLIDTTQAKWQQAMKSALHEIQQAVSFTQEEISQRISILHNLTHIIKNRGWEVIDKSLQSRKKLELFLDSKIKKINQDFENDISIIKDIVKQKDNIDNQYSEIKKQSRKTANLIEQKAKSDKEDQNKKINEAADQEVKVKLTVDFQNIQSLKNQKIENLKTRDYNNYIKKKEENEERRKAYIKNSVIKHLIIMKKVIHSVNWKTKENQNNLNQYLDNVNKQAKNINKIIFQQLNSLGNSYALIIVAESDIFKSQAALDFKKRTSKQDINYILENCPQLKDNKFLRQDVILFYRSYQKEYNEIIETFKKNPDKQRIMIAAKQLRDQKDKNQNRLRKDNIHPATTIARIFAIWSMTKADLSDKQHISIDFQPHPAQIVAISLLIVLNGNTVSNSLIEVLTGEGKSIVLAGLCIYLALKGYRPYCACYSQYLSARDQEEFKELFTLLQVSSLIKYGTFSQHCEDIINQSNKAENIKTFRDHMKSVIMGKLGKNTIDYFTRIFDQTLHKRSRKILIIDQADVFFNENFFGRLYCPSLSLEDQQIKCLIVYIWTRTRQSRQNDQLNKVQKEQIYASNEYKKVAEKYPAIKQLLQNQVVGMLQAAYNFSHGYIIHQNSIKYRDNDSITDKISYGYKTVFANCFEYERKTISQISYNSALKITLNIAPFSYSELPTFFQAILGVSGTVSSISNQKKKMLQQRYGIKDTYEIPSIYGKNQRTKDNFTVVKDEIFYDKIVEHTKNVSQTGRPIALFFKTIKDVTNFYKSPQFKQFTKNTTILTEQTDHASRQIIIKRVGQRGKITILTESFVRGTDFKIFDQKISEIGGLHVIQTFISSGLSEYIQTRGRTARQGNKGSFQVLINQTQLQRFEITCANSGQLQQKMKDAWKKKDLSQCSQLEQRANKARERHKATQSLFKKKATQNQIIQFIYSHNKFNEIKKNHVRTLIGIDGTGSMGYALRKVIDILEDSFSRTKDILDKKNVIGSFQNKVGIYRNYNSDFEQILEYSGFEAKSQKLKQFLQKVQANGGWGNEAMQVLFQHANKIDKLDQIIIIADAKSNTAAQTKWKRGHRYGQDYWISHGFPITNETVELLKIKQRKIKIHTLYIYLDGSNQQKRTELKKYCENISKQTGGASEQFKIKDEKASQFLTGFLVKNILMLLGGQEKGKQLAESYDKDYSVALRL